MTKHPVGKKKPSPKKVTMSEKIFYVKGSLYPHRDFLGSHSGVSDTQIKPLENKWRKAVPKSKKIIAVGQIEKLPHGTLKCFLRNIEIKQVRNMVGRAEKIDIKKRVAIVGVYNKGKVVGKELIYEPSKEEIKSGIPEWKFDAQHTSTMGTDWDYQSTDIWFWTVKGLRENGGIAVSRHIG